MKVRLLVLVVGLLALSAGVTSTQVASVVSPLVAAAPFEDAFGVGTADRLAAKAGGSIGTESTCASVFTEDAAACGGTVYQVGVTVIYPDRNGVMRCIRNWSNGTQTDTFCY